MINFTYAPMPSCCGIGILYGIYQEAQYQHPDGRPMNFTEYYKNVKANSRVEFKYIPSKTRDFTKEEITDVTKRIRANKFDVGCLQMNITHVSQENIDYWVEAGWIVASECQSNHAKYRITTLMLILREYKG